MLAVLGVYGAVLLALVTAPSFKPANMDVGDLHRLVATLSVWISFVLGLELSPVRETPAPEPEDQARAS